MQKIKLLAALTLALAASGSFAQTSKSGFYGVAQFGTAQISDTYTATNNATISATGTVATNAWQIGLGYDLNEYLALEAVAGSALKAETQVTATNGYNQVAKQNVSAYSFSAFAKLPVTSNVKLMAGPTYSMFSSTYQDETSRTTVNKGLLGVTVGASLALDNKTDIRATYTQYQTMKSEVYLGSTAFNREQKVSSFLVGLTVKF